MGMSLTTLHLYGMDRTTVLSVLDDGDLLWEQNAPWLSIVPSSVPEQSTTLRRLEKLAKRLTKENGNAAALLFYYYDDDWFRVQFYQGGRKTAECHCSESWAKIGKQLNALFMEDAPAKALRYASKCYTLEEQVRLLEETVGTALYDVPEMEPRRVPRSDQTLREIKAREAALRKRPNQYTLTELAREDWPVMIQTRQSLLELLRPQWRKYALNSLLYFSRITDHVIPGHPDRMAYPYVGDMHRYRLLLYDGKSGELFDHELPRGIPGKPVWLTETGELVFAFSHIIQETIGEGHWGRQGGKGFVSCLRRDGSERWRFEPDLEDYHLTYVHTDPDGCITLFANSGSGKSANLWRLRGESGEILCHRQLPESDRLSNLVFAEALDSFVYGDFETQGLVVLNSSLEETARWGPYPVSAPYLYFNKENLQDRLLWSNNIYMNPRAVHLFDLQSGAYEKLTLELPAFVLALLPDGRILGVNEKQSVLTVFDRNGIVVSRCSVPGTLGSVCVEDGRVCLLETRGPDTHGFVYDELFDETTYHVWRLDAVH